MQKENKTTVLSWKTLTRGWAFLSVISVPLFSALLFQLFWGLSIAVREHRNSPSSLAKPWKQHYTQIFTFPVMSLVGPFSKVKIQKLSFVLSCTLGNIQSGWDGDNFLLSIPDFGCDWNSVGNTAVLVIAEQCVHNVKAFSFSCSAPPVGRKLGESTTCTPGTDWPAGICHDI